VSSSYSSAKAAKPSLPTNSTTAVEPAVLTDVTSRAAARCGAHIFGGVLLLAEAVGLSRTDARPIRPTGRP
jgi:hypothetical protein